MPKIDTTKSPALLRAAAKDAKFAELIGVSQRVAREVARATKRQSKLKPTKKK